MFTSLFTEMTRIETRKAFLYSHGVLVPCVWPCFVGRRRPTMSSDVQHRNSVIDAKKQQLKSKHEVYMLDCRWRSFLTLPSSKQDSSRLLQDYNYSAPLRW